jgi:uncharacterized membrane protein (UPF0127 family)
MAKWQLTNRETNRLVVPELDVAACFWSRLQGWQFRSRPATGVGLLLAPCASIHTCWMRFALDIVWLDREGTVLAVGRDVRPWRFVFAPRGTRAVLEVPAGEAERIQPGARLMLAAHEPASRKNLPPCLRQLAS